jgi:hypothetical protein
MGVFEKYTKFKDISFEACCAFPSEKITDQEWKDFEEKLLNTQ